MFRIFKLLCVLFMFLLATGFFVGNPVVLGATQSSISSSSVTSPSSTNPSSSSSSSNPKQFSIVPTYLPSILSKAKSLGPLPPNGHLNFQLILPLRDSVGLKSLLNQLYSPASPLYHHFLTPSQFYALYGPDQAEVAALTNYMQSKGVKFQMSTTNPNVAEMEGTVSQIQNTLNTQIDSFSCNGSVFYSATSMAQLPQQFSNIQMIYGLENYDSQLGSLGAVPLYRTVGTVTPGQTTSNILYYSPSEIRQMYNATDLLKAGYNGHGVSIAIVDAYGDPYIQKELQNFSAEFGLPFYNGTLHIIPVGPYNATQGILTGWNVEIVLDVEWAHAMAPNATINLYVASDSGSYLFNAVLNATLGSDGTAYGVYNNNIISMSWGEPEKDFCTSNPTLYPWLDQVFQMDAALGITAFASSGDRGAYDQTFGQTSAYGGASYPSTDPYVTGVGGTSLYMNTTSGYYQFPYANATGTYGNETAWSWNNFLFYMWGTGGGWSTVFGQPSWQTGSGVVNNGERGAPDVAWDADPLTGVLVSVFDNYTKSYDYYPVGGTSVGSPCWAGSMALIDQKAGRSLGFINPTIYSILNNGAEYSKAFHDITVGNNNPNSATTGWDALTGVGSPNLGELANYLAPTGRVLVVVTNDFSKASGLGRAYAYGQVVNLTAVVANNGTISGPVTATITSSTGAMIASNIALNYSASSGAWLGSYKIKATDPSGECSVTVTAINASSSGEGYTTFAVGDSVTILNPSYFTRYFYQVGDTICVYSYVVNTTDYRVTNGSYTATFYLAQNQATLNGLGKVEGKVSLQYNSTDGLWEGNFSIRSGVDQGAWILVVNGTDLNGDKGSAYTWINVGLDVLLFTDSPTYVLRDTISIFTYPAYENWSEATTGTFTAVIYEGPTFVAKVPLAYNKSVTFWYCGFTTSAGSPTGFYTITVNGTDGEGNSGSSTTVVRVAQYSLSVKVIVSNQIVPPSNVNEASVLAKITYPNGAAMTVGNVIGIICLNLSGIGLYPVNWFPMTYNSKAGGFIAINLFYGMNASLIGNYTVYVLAYDASGNCGTAITSFYSLILSYSIQGGGTVYSAPTLLYISNGVNQTATLNASPETYYLDAGSSWSVTNPLVGSSSIERWIASQTTSGTAISSQTLVFVYHHQFSDTLSYSVSGRGSPTAPTFTANQFGSSHVQTLTTAPTGYWFDAGSSWNVSNPLSGSTSSERWQTNQATSGTLLSWSVTTLAFTYYNQYYCAISTSGLSSNYPATITFTQYGYSFNPTTSTMWNNWCDSASSLSITSTISGGTGERWITPSSTSWTVNSSTSSSMQYYHQFCDTLSYSISGGGSATAPIFTANSEGQQCSVTLTTSASGYWFDAGSSWNVSNPLSGSTSSERWQTNQATLGTISPFQSITLTYYHQYLVTASYSTSDSSIPSSNAVLSGTQYGSNSYQLNLITLNQTAWLDANTAWSINTPITAESGTERWSASNGTSGTVNGPLTINPKYWHQYLVMASYSTSDGSTPLDSVVLSGAQFGNPAFTLTLITSNQATWLDAGSSWSVNNPITAVSGTERWYAVSGTSESSLASAIVIAPSYYHQYVVSFKFKDSTGTNTITPAFFRMETNNFTVISVPSFELWLDSGSESQIYSVIWENMDVKPTSNVTYIVNAPLNETILDRVFNAKLLVTDYLGIPISGAKVTFTLANGTTIQSTTGSDGTASLPMIPLGTFHASISYLGTTTTVVGDASMQSVTKGKIFASYPTLSLIAVVVIAAVATFMLVRRRHSSPKQKNSGVPIQQNTPTSAVPSDFVHASRVKADSGLV